MKLIDLLVKELPSRGGWPEEAKIMSQDAAGMINAHRNERLVFLIDQFWTGTSKNDECKNFSPFYLKKATDWNTNTVTREQYEAALAASEGWIEWHGGECPVDSDAIVEVKCRWHNQHQYNNDRAGDFYWAHTGSNADIIAYRLQKPTKSDQVRADAWRSYAGITETDDESDLNECIGQGVDMPEWNGDGLPPVGTVCMANLANGWTDVKVAYIGDEGGCREALVFEIKTSKPAWADEFRPLRTEAEKDRDEFVKLVMGWMHHAGDAEIALIYDAIAAGKIPGVKLEGK